jgi:hypothetical protein
VKVKESHAGLTSGKMFLSNHTEMGGQFSLAAVELKLVMNRKLGFNCVNESTDELIQNIVRSMRKPLVPRFQEWILKTIIQNLVDFRRGITIRVVEHDNTRLTLSGCASYLVGTTATFKSSRYTVSSAFAGAATTTGTLRFASSRVQALPS